MDTPQHTEEEPYRTILAFEKVELQKPIERSTMGEIKEGRTLVKYDAWRQNPLSIMPNILAWTWMFCCGGYKNFNSPKPEEHFQLDYTYYPRVQQLTQKGTILEQHLLASAPQQPKNILVTPRECDSLMHMDAERFAYDMQDLLPDTEEFDDFRREFGYAPGVPGSLDAFVFAFHNKKYDVKAVDFVEKGLCRRGIDAVAVNLLYNRNFLDMLHSYSPRGIPDNILPGLKDAHWFLLVSEEMYERDMRAIGNAKGDFSRLDTTQRLIAQQKATPIIAYLMKTGVFQPVGAMVPPNMPKSTESQILQKTFKRVPSVARTSGEQIYNYLVEKHKTHPRTITEYTRLEEEAAEEKREETKTPKAPRPTKPFNGFKFVL